MPQRAQAPALGKDPRIDALSPQCVPACLLLLKREKACSLEMQFKLAVVWAELKHQTVFGMPRKSDPGDLRHENSL